MSTQAKAAAAPLRVAANSESFSHRIRELANSHVNRIRKEKEYGRVPAPLLLNLFLESALRGTFAPDEDRGHLLGIKSACYRALDVLNARVRSDLRNDPFLADAARVLRDAAPFTLSGEMHRRICVELLKAPELPLNFVVSLVVEVGLISDLVHRFGLVSLSDCRDARTQVADRVFTMSQASGMLSVTAFSDLPPKGLEILQDLDGFEWLPSQHLFMVAGPDQSELNRLILAVLRLNGGIIDDPTLTRLCQDVIADVGGHRVAVTEQDVAAYLSRDWSCPRTPGHSLVAG